MNPDRYFVDERVGCIAVRDRSLTDPEYPGLHEDTTGVVKYWHGHQNEEVCPTCGHHRMGFWGLTDDDRQQAKSLCDELNRKGLR